MSVLFIIFALAKNILLGLYNTVYISYYTILKIGCSLIPFLLNTVLKMFFAKQGSAMPSLFLTQFKTF